MTVEIEEKQLHPWTKAAHEKQEAEMRAALEKNRGVIADAARALGLARSHANKIIKKFELSTFAEKLRLDAGAKRDWKGRVGRPPL